MLRRALLLLLIPVTTPVLAQANKTDPPSLPLPGLEKHPRIGEAAPQWETGRWLNLADGSPEPTPPRKKYGF